MRKLFLSFIALTAFIATASAQTATTGVVPPVDPKVIMNKVEKTKAAVNDPKKGLKAAAWDKYAEALTEAYLANIKYIYIGAEAKAIVEAMGNLPDPTVPIEKIGDKEFKLYKYPAVDIYFTMDDKVAFFIERTPLLATALEDREVALLKALSLDAKLLEKIKPRLEYLVQDYLTQMQCRFNSKKYTEAIAYAEKAAKLQENPVLADAKSIESTYFAVICAMQANDYNSAKKNLNVLISKNDMREGETLYYLGISEDKMGNIDEAKKVLENGVELFPGNQDILKSLIDLYIRSNEDPSKVIPFIKAAQEKDPSNAVLYIVEGVTYEKLNQLDKSIIAYENAIKYDPKSFMAYYNIGYTYSVEADKIVDVINNLDYTNKTEIDKRTKEVKDLRKKALSFLEKAYEINPADENVLSLLKSIYFVFRDDSPEMQKNFDKFDALYKAIKK